ncbi:tRNA (adenine(22)-N(1))-methyltransferase [Anaeromicropila populeti]|uniref:tRNA (Adenine22-N1)-methyltransferase n=1 Tax=Anaeromicropila populeti TaxID=37658 RepID=A0A1I6JSS8_9FIRM|nr:class I SAM-dependent methyltransferase [Anaeromicropila populeti]SFR82029.1 tRNA (adenine22-N1)-methyltransferase [Anaeromicropila populeti]
MQLSKRLGAVAGEVMADSCVADIGCDHAYVAIYLAQNSIVKHMIAMDVRKGPLEKAKTNIDEYGLSDQIEVRLSDGAKELKAGEVDTIVIAGMGGALITKILEESIQVLDQVTSLVLQPQTEVPAVRRFLHKNHFMIEKEIMLIEDEKYYTVLSAKPGEQNRFNLVEYEFGKYLLEKKDAVLWEFLKNQIDKYEDILDKLMKNSKNIIRQEEIKETCRLLRLGLLYYEEDSKGEDNCDRNH